MEVKAIVRQIRISPRKVRLVAGVVRGLSVENALNQLRFTNKKSVLPIKKLIDSAVANALNNYELKKDNLFVKEIRVDEGATMKRWMPRARGRATPIHKRTSHVSLVLGELVDSGKVEAKKKKVEAPIKLSAEPKQDAGIKLEKTSKEEPVQPEDAKKKIVDPRGEGRGKNAKIEGKSTKAFGSKIFRRKSG